PGIPCPQHPVQEFFRRLLHRTRENARRIAHPGGASPCRLDQGSTVREDMKQAAAEGGIPGLGSLRPPVVSNPDPKRSGELREDPRRFKDIDTLTPGGRVRQCGAASHRLREWERNI